MHGLVLVLLEPKKISEEYDMTFHLTDCELSAKDTVRGKRVFVSNALLVSKSELTAGDKLAPLMDHSKKQITLIKADDDAKGCISVTKSGKRLVVDLHNKQVQKLFGASIKRVVVRFYKNRLVISPTYAALRAVRRLMAARERIRAGKPLLFGEVCHGVGGLGFSLHEGFDRAGVETSLAFANDIDSEALEASVRNNPIWDKNSIALACSIEQIPTEELPQCDFLIAGLSCKGASRQSRTGKKISSPEFHPEAGWLVAPFYHLVASRINPLVVVLENVREYLDTASAQILRESMDRLGYECHEEEICSQSYGSMENRKRMTMVFLTRGMLSSGEPSLRDRLSQHHSRVHRVIGDVIDHESAPDVPAALDAPQNMRNGWYLKSRLLERDAEARAKGVGHRAVIADNEDTRVSTITASYGKGVRLDETVIESPCGQWLRLMTGKEHATIKGLPVSLINGLGKTAAHRVLGNSVTREPWTALGEILASIVTKWADVSPFPKLSLAS